MLMLKPLSLKAKESVLIAVIAFCYFFTSLAINDSLLNVSLTPYYNYLIESFSHGKIFIEGNVFAYDLSNYQGKLTMYWGITPAIYILPFYFSRIFQSDIFYTLVAGVVNVILFLNIIKAQDQYLKTGLSREDVFISTLAFAFVSPNYYLSLGGRIWHTNQIIAILYLLFSVYLLFRYLISKKRRNFVMAAILFTMAWLARNSLIVYAFMFFYALLKVKKDFKHNLLILLLISAIGVSFYFIYNFVRFGDISETGISYQMADPRFTNALMNSELFSLKYLGSNFNHYFLKNVSLSVNYPYINLDPNGNSIFSTYPYLLIIFSIFTIRYLSDKQKIYSKVLLLISTISIFVLLTFFGTGWTQFGARYFLDAIPAVMMLSVFLHKYLPKTFLYVLVFYGFVVNYVGSIYFFDNF